MPNPALEPISQINLNESEPEGGVRLRLRVLGFELPPQDASYIWRAHMISSAALEPRKLRIEPRGLSRVEAAGYVGVSPSLFDEMVRDRRMPNPKRINRRTVWDRKQLDIAFEALPDDSEDRNPWDN
jgi:predicted DNA-binding transcriptional regulator AlpA